MKTILVPLDFSPASKNAFQYAARLAAPFKGKLILLHVYTPHEMDPFVPLSLQNSLLEAKQEAALAYFSSLEAEIPSSILESIELDFQILLGGPTDQILWTAKDLQVDMIVMGMRGGNIFAKKLLGSTSTFIIQRASCPVLVVPEHYEYKAIEHIGYASNFEEEDIQAIQKMLDVADKFGAQAHCVHIHQNGDKGAAYKKDILEKAFKHEFPLKSIELEILSKAKVVEGLNDFIDAHQIDLLVMLTHKRGLISQLFHQSHSRKMLIKSQVPIMVFQMDGNGTSSFNQPILTMPSDV